MATPIKWVKFYKTGSNEVLTFFVNDNVLQNNGQTHEFADAEDAVAKSTVEVFTFWDGVPAGVGSQTA